MRTAATLLGLLLLAGCRGGSTAIDGTLLDPDDATHVWIDGGAGRADIEGVAFRIPDARGDTIDLRFASASDDAGTMRILGLPKGAALTLHGVWFRDGQAFASAIELDGARLVTVNGLRMSSPGRMPTALDHQVTVLAASRDGEALIVRPIDPDLPDLRVIVGPGTAVRSVDGEPTSIERFAFGDSLVVRGAAEGGYVLATEISLPRRLAVTGSSSSPAAENARESASSASEPRPVAREAEPSRAPPVRPATPATRGPEMRRPGRASSRGDRE